MTFAFPFLKKGQRDADAAVKFTDEHEIYQLLADREPGGSFLVSKNGFWHGGIHITENGAGSKLDLKQGIRCIADGHVIAYRVNRTYPVSQLGGVQAPYSTGFALVRHTMEFPKGAKLTFYSLYMHLLAYEEYEQDATTKKPTYWPMQYKVTEHAQDKPDPSRVGQLPEAGQQGLRVRSGARGGHRGAHPLGILPQGACVSIGEQQKGWGKITDVHGAQLYAPKVGELPPTSVVGGWIFLGNEHGGPVVQGFMPDDAFDRVTVTLSSSGSGSDANAQGIPVKAGDLIGHLGRFDSLSASPPSATRMAHIEVFCDESIKSFIEQGRSWVASHGAHPDDWKPLGLSSEPTLLRIAEGTKLYRNAEQEGAAPPVTGVAQRWSLAELARDPNRKHLEATADRSGRKSNWWRVGSADQRGQAIDGWVREENFAGGTVTRELAQKWVDFACLDGAHDPAHTIFATTRSWVDFASGANVPDAKSRAKLSPMMQSVHQTLFPQGDGAHAVDDLCLSYAGESGHYPWLMQAASRLIVKHESEWSNPQKWRQLYTEMENGATNPQYEEQKRIEKLAWWDEVKAKVPGFPGSDVFHINPVGLVGNFAVNCDCATKFKSISPIILRHEGGYVNNPNDRGGPTKYGITLATWQAYAQEDVGIDPTLENLKNLTMDQAETIYLKRYWEPKGFCRFNDMRVALMVYDWIITSGGAAKQVQDLLNNTYDARVDADGAMGNQTVQAINGIVDQEALLNEIADLRKQYYTALTLRNSSQLVFLRGWLNRVDDCLSARF
ncbi:hypothetical protein BTHE68_07920 [Burkholderia sp. THE68]|uniref:glycoside hydrolase family 108 protein n=1 Tax=Burkholderia sp. THE68 TaxID=758782 RepID=UPI001316C7C1|nr:glycosyl hydrolase 108 family protein [Burkholderia sp. THE68]BBU27058.1 hypothetical protein BTHE68_07920 [Burkholderia sp. THE68]